MSREEILRFAFEFARDEYARTASRLALLETKAQLTAAVGGIIFALLAALWPTLVPHSKPSQVLLLAGALIALISSLAAAILGSILVDVRSPESAEAVAKRCEAILDESGQSAHATGHGVAQSLWGEASASYRGATREILDLASDRARKLKFSQMTLIVGLLFLSALFLPPLLLGAVCVFNAAE